MHNAIYTVLVDSEVTTNIYTANHATFPIEQYTKLQYRFAVTSGAPSTITAFVYFRNGTMRAEGAEGVLTYKAEELT